MKHAYIFLDELKAIAILFDDFILVVRRIVFVPVVYVIKNYSSALKNALYYFSYVIVDA
jgi:hypothetical protein